jgi:SAM-dependent methyltransferase
MDLTISMRRRDCPVCGKPSADASAFLEASFNESRLTASSFASRKSPEFMSYRLVRCAGCSTLYASEAPSAEALAGAYHAADFDSADEEAFAADTYQKALEPMLAALPARGMALEIGAGTGVFLRQLRRLGFGRILGIEPSSAAIAAAAADVRPHIRQGVFIGDEFPAESVSLICCFQTLEHVPEPRRLVEAARQMLTPGGILALVTHDYTAPLNRALGKRSPIIDIEHLQLFCPAALSTLLEAGGYDLLDMRPIKNVYPASYWLNLLPLPESLKRPALKLATAANVAKVPVGLNVGNLMSVAQKPTLTPQA